MSLIEEINKNYVLYVLGGHENLEGFCMNPFGLNVNYINPMSLETETFIDLLNQLDGISYGDKTLGMPKWVALDCGMLPSAFVGLAKKVRCLEDELKEKFSIPEEYSGLVPLTMYCAIPSAEKGTWIGHSLASAEKGKGLGLLTKLIALKMYQVQKLVGVAQYDNSSVKTHTKISKLKLISALTPAHSIPDMTFVYQHDVNQDELIDVFDKKGIYFEPSFLLNARDYEMKLKMQQKIERNTADFFIIPPGQIIEDGEICVPILKIDK